MSDMLSKPFKSNLSLSDFSESSIPFVCEYSCPLCEGILFDSVIDKCGHSFCFPCVETLIKSSKPCPFTKTFLKISEIFKNSIVNATIEKQLVICPNKPEGCEWTGKLIQRKDHLLYECPKELIECKYGCNIRNLREKVKSHESTCDLKEVECQYCKVQVQLKLIKNHYNDECKSYPTKCTCGKSIALDLLQIHCDNDCELTIVDCSYKALGCSKRDIRKNIKKHQQESSEQHNQMLINKVMNLEQALNIQNEQTRKLEQQNDLLNLELYNLKAINERSQEESQATISNLRNEILRVRYHCTLPFSNFIPDFSQIFNASYNQENEVMLDNSLKNQVFEFDEYTGVLKKISENYGWYGLSSSYLFNDQDDSISALASIIINIKILKTLGGCIMLGIGFTDVKLPLIGGFYKNANLESYMFYCYNGALYRNGILYVKSTSEGPFCSDGDVITLIIDTLKKELMIKVNGTLNIQAFFMPEYENEVKRQNLRIIVDLTDPGDQIVFI